MYDGAVVNACIDSRAAYDRVARYVDKSEFTPMAGYWWDLLVDWYLHDPDCERVDRAILRERGERRANAKHRETMVGYFDDLPAVGSPANVVSDLLEVKRHAKANELGASVGGDPAKLLILAREYVELLEAENIEQDTWVEAGDWDEVDEALNEQNRTKLLPLALNERCAGGAIPGHHIVLFGPPEIGKSLVAINMVCGFLRQGRRVLYVSNEDSARVIKERIRCNLSGMSAELARANRSEAIAIARSKGVDNLFVGNMDPGDVAQIERKAQEVDADVIVVDQLRNLHATTVRANAGITQRLDAVAQEFRSLLIRGQYIGVSLMQANAGEHGKRQVWMHYDDVDSSRTGVPASADLLVAIGGDDDMLAQNRRAFSLCKNKLGGNHEGFIVRVTPELSRCK